MNSPYFSVIIPTYNRESFLFLATNSVLNQSFQDFELIIVDDGSTDNTKELLKSLKDPRIKIFYQDNKGVSSARNKGISESFGEFICFLDSDDQFNNSKLEKAKEVIDKNPDIKVFHTLEKWVRDGREVSQGSRYK